MNWIGEELNLDKQDPEPDIEDEGDQDAADDAKEREYLEELEEESGSPRK